MKKLFLTLLTAFFINFNASAQSFKNVILVNTNMPFYIDIFEMSYGEAQSLGFDFNFRIRSKNHPAQLKGSDAAKACQAKSMRLPYKSEWMAAASNMGKNTDYTITNNKLTSGNGSMLPNIADKMNGSTMEVYRDGIAVDSIGTIGMTGNRSEWVIDDDTDEVILCGGNFNSSTSEVHLSRICSEKVPKNDKEYATVRCVVSHSKDVEAKVQNSGPIDYSTGRTIPYDTFHANRLGVIQFGKSNNPAPNFVQNGKKSGNETKKDPAKDPVTKDDKKGSKENTKTVKQLQIDDKF